jgi:hypothetical protein
MKKFEIKKFNMKEIIKIKNYYKLKNILYIHIIHFIKIRSFKKRILVKNLKYKCKIIYNNI